MRKVVSRQSKIFGFSDKMRQVADNEKDASLACGHVWQVRYAGAPDVCFMCGTPSTRPISAGLSGGRNLLSTDGRLPWVKTSKFSFLPGAITCQRGNYTDEEH